MKLKTTLGAGLICLAATAAQAQSFTLNDGSTVNFAGNPLGVGASGTFSGTLQQGGASSAFSCTYDAVQGRITGSPACGQILGGSVTGGLNVATLERDIVSTRLSVASQGQASATAQLLSDITSRTIGTNVVANVQASLQAGTGDASNVFGAPQYGAWSSAGGSFIDDKRFGLERDSNSYVFTAGLDHTVQNWMVGIYGGYLKSDVDLISLGGDLESDGWLLGTYVTRVIDQVFSVTAGGTYADSQSHLSRTSAGTRISAAFDHKEWSASINGNAFWLLAPRFGLTATAGLSYEDWNDDEYTDSSGILFGESGDENLWAKAGGVATFFAGPIRPYATATYSRRVTTPTFYVKRDRVNVGGGFAIGQSPISGAFEVNTELLNQDQRELSVGLHLRLAV